MKIFGIDIVEIINNLPPALSGGLMAMFIATLRVVYDKEETRPIRVMLEATICGCLAITVSYLVDALGIDRDWSMFLSGVIGYLGSHKVKRVAVKFLEKKVKDELDD
jgi:lambda family phage holin